MSNRCQTCGEVPNPDGQCACPAKEKQVVVNWDIPMLKRFKKEYEKHKDKPKDSFMFEGNEYVVGYAKYLIEYLEGRLK